MFTCRSIQKKFSAFLDNELSGNEEQRVREHVEQCRRCAAELRALREQNEMLVTCFSGIRESAPVPAEDTAARFLRMIGSETVPVIGRQKDTVPQRPGDLIRKLVKKLHGGNSVLIYELSASGIFAARGNLRIIAALIAATIVLLFATELHSI